MIMLELNTQYNFVFESNLINGSQIKITLSVTYGSKADYIIEYNGYTQHGLEIVGAKEIVYELDDEYLSGFALTNYPISIYDKEGTITDLILSEFVNLAKVIIYVQVDNINIFIGSIDPLSISYSQKDCILDCSFKPETYILNETETWLNGSINYQPIGVSLTGSPILIGELIERLYKIVKNDIQIQISQSWNFAAINDNISPPIFIERGFANIYVDEHLYGNYNDNFIPNGITTYGQLIKYLAFTFGCITGMISSNKAIFYPFIGEDKPSVAIDDTKLLDFRIDGIRDKISYLTISNTGDSLGTPTNISGKYLDKEILKSFYFEEYGYFKIATIKIDNIWYNFAEGILKYWSRYLMSKSYMFNFNFELNGIDYNFTNDIIINGNRYTPIYMKVKLDTCTTEFKAIRF